jgi:hypothetical protein
VLAAGIVASALGGCTSLLGTFDVGAGSSSPDADTADGPSGGGDGGTDALGSDTAPPLVCNAPQVACGTVCATLATSSDHCGVCNHSCGGGACQGGVCKPFKLYEGATDAGAPVVGPLEVGGTDIFFSPSVNDNKLVSCPKTGCTLAPHQIAAMGYPIDAISFVQPGTIVFLSAPTQSTQRPALYACSPAGCPSPPTSFAADGLNGIEPRLRSLNGRIFYNPGGSGLSYSTCAAGAGTCSAATQLGTATTRGTHGLTADATNLYFIDSAARGSTIATCAQSAAPCTPSALVPGDQSTVEGVVADGGKLYWLFPGRAGFTEGRLMACDLPACATPKPLANTLDSPVGLVVDAGGAYWLTAGNKLQRCLPNGCLGGPQDFAGPLDTPHSLVADPAFVYWAEKTSVWRLAK